MDHSYICIANLRSFTNSHANMQAHLMTEPSARAISSREPFHRAAHAWCTVQRRRALGATRQQQIRYLAISQIDAASLSSYAATLGSEAIKRYKAANSSDWWSRSIFSSPWKASRSCSTTRGIVSHLILRRLVSSTSKARKSLEAYNQFVCG